MNYVETPTFGQRVTTIPEVTYPSIPNEQYLVRDFKTYQTLTRYPCYVSRRGYGRPQLQSVIGFDIYIPEMNNVGQLFTWYLNGYDNDMDIDYDWDDPVVHGPVEPLVQGPRQPRPHGPQGGFSVLEDLNYYYNDQLNDVDTPTHSFEHDLIEDFLNMREFGYISDPFVMCTNYTIPQS